MASNTKKPVILGVDEPRATSGMVDDDQGRRRIEKALFNAALGVSRAQGQQLFDELIRSAAETLEVEYALISLLDESSSGGARTIAFYDNGKIGDNFHYRLEGTPCENVIGKEFRFFASDVRQRFPDPHVRALQIHGYAGVPLFDSRGNALGLVAVMSPRPIHDEQLFESILRIFAERVAAEVERARIDDMRLEREQALRKSEERLRATVAAALDCILGMDSDGNIIEFNPAAEKCFGYSRQQVLGRSLADAIIPPSMREAHRRGMSRYLTTGDGPFLGKRIEVTAMRSDGSEFPAELAIGVTRDPSGHIFIGYLRDISQIKRAEQGRSQLEAQLRQAQKMEAIGHLTGGIAHDFNNILTGIMGYIDMAQERAGQARDAKLEKYLDRAKRSGQRARDLIQQMLTFSRGKRGTPRPIDFCAVVGESVKLLESSLPSSVVLSVDLAPDLPTVMMDPVHLEQIVVNLCINARDAMNGSGALEVAVRAIDCSTACVCASCRAPLRGPYVAVSVKDNGPGIQPEHIERIFEPFFSTKEVGKGSGMGLSTVHGIVHEYGGHITVDNRPGAGATFNILLPLLAVSGPGYDGTTGEPDFTVAARALTGSVLLVDDDESVLEFMTDLLENWGMTVTAMPSATAALDQLDDENHRYDLLIVDQTMPRMTGTQLAGTLRQRFPSLPIILYTGYGENLSERDIQGHGIRALVKKPIDTKKFFEIVQGILS